MKAQRPRQARGAALITALLIAALATALVATMFWRQWSAISTEQSLRNVSQAQWLVRGGVDWVKLILDEDRRTNGGVTHEGQIWATPLARTSLSDFLTRSQATASSAQRPGQLAADEVPLDAWIEGHMEDAQSRYNLRNLMLPASVPQTERDVFARLCESVSAQGDGEADCDALLTTLRRFGPRQGTPASGGSAPSQAGSAPAGTAQEDDPSPTLGVAQWRELRALLPQTMRPVLDRLEEVATLLPQATSVNLNTASPAVLAAVLGVSLYDAQRIRTARDNAYFRYPQDLRNVFPERTNMSIDESRVGVRSDYFFMHAALQVEDYRYQLLALLGRSSGTTALVWMRSL